MALKNGKHVICEKPLVLTTHEMQEVKKLASKKNLICTCFLMQRYRKPSIILKKNIRNNFFGSIYHADINIILRKSSTINKDFFVNKKYSGSGLIYDIGTHFIDLVCHLANYPDPKLLCVVGNKTLSCIHKEKNSLNKNFNINDFVSGLIKFKNGLTINFQFSYFSNIKKDKKDIIFYTDKGVIEWPNLKFNLLNKNQNFSSKLVLTENKKASIFQLQNFISAIKGRKIDIASLDEMLKLTKIIESLHKSELKNCLVRL